MALGGALASGSATAQDQGATPHGAALTRLISRVHSEVNRTFRPRMPWHDACDTVLDCDGVFDCENYMLEKARLLYAAGVPRADLRFWAVTGKRGGRHAVLLVRNGEDWIMLDNVEARPLALAKVSWYRNWRYMPTTVIALPLLRDVRVDDPPQLASPQLPPLRG